MMLGIAHGNGNRRGNDVGRLECGLTLLLVVLGFRIGGNGYGTLWDVPIGGINIFGNQLTFLV